MPPPNTPEEFFEEEYRQRRNSAVAHAARRQHFNLSPHDEDDAEDEFDIDFGVHLSGSQNEAAEGQQPAPSHHLRRRTSLEQSQTHSHSRTSSRSHSPHRARNQRDLALTRSISPSTAGPATATAHPQTQNGTHATQPIQLAIPNGFFLEHDVVEDFGRQNDIDETPTHTPGEAGQPLAHANADGLEDAAGEGEVPRRKTRVKIQKMDWGALEYVNPYDENLDCPICRSPLVKPHITTCFHIFCYKCLCKSLEHGNRCPIDRNPLQLFNTSRGRFPACPAPPIISNQLDNLQVRCPNRRCDHISARSLIEHHYKKECPFTKIVCPDPSCDKFVTRRESEDGSCLHKAVDCVYCSKLVELADLDDHYDNDCNQKELMCEHCLAAIPRHRHGAHVADCAERRLECKYKPSGCTFSSRKKDYGDHDRTCLYGMFMRLDRACRTDIGGLSTVVQDSQDRVRKLEDQLCSSQPASEGQPREQPLPMPVFTPLLENTTSDMGAGESLPLIGPLNAGDEAGAALRPSVPPSGGVWLSTDAQPAAASADASRALSAGSAESTTNAANGEDDDDRMDRIMAYIDVFDAKVENLERYLGEVDARQAQLFMNELSPLRDQMLEMHNTMCHMGMHVRWLMETFKQTAKRSVGLRTGVTPGTPGGDEDGSVPAATGAGASPSGAASPVATSSPNQRPPSASIPPRPGPSFPPSSLRGPPGRMNLPMRRMPDRENPPRL
ncbi:traf-like signal protein [Ophiostoma piceae UAMH 11346]|uniref:Traf-like signal protein n=1 Tax=Ophiostoma piceae (strain UAMH 11346) TaxID=1262450 RepID=S3CMH8_OPHP1|nr:traf-like signal protein [Ophiostoma piceae UAMH 11346]